MAERKDSSSSAEDNAEPESSDEGSRAVVNSVVPQDHSPSEKNSEYTLHDSDIRGKGNEKISESSPTITGFTRKTDGACLIKLDDNKTYYLPFVLNTNNTQPEVKIVQGSQCIEHENVWYQVTRTPSGSPCLKHGKSGKDITLREVCSTGDRREESIEGKSGSLNEFRQTLESHIGEFSVMKGPYNKSKTGAGISPSVNTVQKSEREMELRPGSAQTHVGDSEQTFNNKLSKEEIEQISLEQREKICENPVDQTCMGLLNVSQERCREYRPLEGIEKIPEREISINDSDQKDKRKIDSQVGVNNIGDSAGESDNLSGEAIRLDKTLSREAENQTDENTADQLTGEKSQEPGGKKNEVTVMHVEESKVESSEAHLNQTQESHAASMSTNDMASISGVDKSPIILKGGSYFETPLKPCQEQSDSKRNLSQTIKETTHETSQQEADNIPGCNGKILEASMQQIDKEDHAKAVERSSDENSGICDDGECGSKVIVALETQSVQPSASASERVTGLEEHNCESIGSTATPEIISENKAKARKRDFKDEADEGLILTLAENGASEAKIHLPPPGEKPLISAPKYNQGWQCSAGKGPQLKLYINYRRLQEDEMDDDTCLHKIHCYLGFLTCWNFYNQTFIGRKLLDAIVSNHNCHVELSTDTKLQGFFIFKISDKHFEEESDVKRFVEVVLDAVNICAQQQLCLDLVSVNQEIQEDVQQKIEHTEELGQCVWIEFGGKYDPKTMYTVCLQEKQTFVQQQITDLIRDAKDCFNNHEEMIPVDFIWQKVMIEFSYLQKIKDKFPQIIIVSNEEATAFVLRGPKDVLKAAKNDLLALLETAYKEVHEESFAPLCEFEIFSHQEMCDYINQAIPNVPIVWIPNHKTKKIHLFARNPEQLRGIDKSIKGCVKEKDYPISKDPSMFSHETIRSIEELKEKYMGKILIHSSKTGLQVTTSDSLFESVDATILEIISRERDAAQAGDVSKRADEREKPLGSQTDPARTDGYQETKDLSSNKGMGTNKAIVKTVDVKNKNVFHKLLEEIKSSGQYQHVIIQEVNTGTRVGFKLKGSREEDVSNVFQDITQRVESEEQQLQPEQGSGDSVSDTAKLEEPMTPDPHNTGQSQNNTMSDNTTEEVVTPTPPPRGKKGKFPEAANTGPHAVVDDATTGAATATNSESGSSETAQPATTSTSKISTTSLTTTTSSLAINTSQASMLTQSAGTSITKTTSALAAPTSTAPAIATTAVLESTTFEPVIPVVSATSESLTSLVQTTSSSRMISTSQCTSMPQTMFVMNAASATSVPRGITTTSTSSSLKITTADTSAPAEAEECELQKDWLYPNGKKITLMKATSCEADVIIIPGKSDTESHFHIGDKKFVRVKVTDWTEGKAKTDLQQAIEQVLDKILEKTVGISIKTMEGWNFHHYLKCFLYEIYKCLMRNEGKPCPIECVILLVDDASDYNNARNIIQTSFKLKQDKPEVVASQKLLLQEQGSIFKRIRVRVQKGQLHEAQAEVLVNTVNKNLDLAKGAISSSLLVKAGNGIQRELQQYKQNFAFGQVLKTGVGSLLKPCKAIFHGVLYTYKENDSYFKVFEDFLLGCLEDANKKYNSIAFPPIGTGGLGYPKDIVASIMFQSVAKFEQAHPTCKLKDVIFVIYEKDQETLKVFEELYGKCVDATAADHLKAVPTDKYVSKVLKYGQIQAQAKLGTFENECQNCLLVLWEKQCLQSISDKNPILQSAGNTVTQKWKDHRNSRLFHQDVLVTPGGNLRYTKIVHVASDINNIRKAAKAGLNKADLEKMRTVVVPITHDDVLSRDPNKFCTEILKAVNELSIKLKFVQSVTLVIQGQHNFSLFNEVFEQESRMYGTEEKIEASKNNDVDGKKTVQSPISVPPDSEPLVQNISLSERGHNPKTQQQLMKGAEVLLAGHKIELVLTDEEKRCIIVSGDIKSKQDLVERFSKYHSNKVERIVYPYEEKSALIIFEKEVDFKTLEVCTKPFRVEPILPQLLQNLEFLLHDALVERAYNSGQMETMITSLEEISGVRIKKTNKQVFVCAVTFRQMVNAKHYLEDFCEKRLSIKINDLGKNMSSSTQDEQSYSNIDTLNEVSEVEFKALEILENGFKRMENIQLSWDENNAVLIQGPPGLAISIKQHLSKQLEVLRTKQSEEISLDEEEKKVVKDVIEEMPSKDTICVFSEKKSQVVVYSDKQDDIMKFKHKLKFRSGKVKESGRSGRRLTDVKSQATEDPDECFRSSVWSGGQGQQFSGSKDALDKAVFNTKENIKVAVYMADILNLPVNCIVNAANDRMQHGGGVARVIADAAGPELVKEGDAIIREKGMIPVGVQVTTTAGKLPYKCVIHTVGPCWSDYQPHNLQKVKDCENDLYTAIHGCFLEAEKNGCSSVALPAVSSGIYAVPQDMCVVQYARAVLDYSRKSVSGKSLTEIHFVDRLPHLVKLIQDTFRTMLQDGKEPNYNVNNYVISSSGYQRQSEATTMKGHQANEHHQHGQAHGLKNAGNSSQLGPVGKIDFSPVYYESGEHGKKQSVFQISLKPVVRIYKGDVLKVKNMDAVICADDKNGSGLWNIASELKKKEKYKKLKEAGFKKEKPGLGDVVVTYAGEHSYQVIFHVVIETYETKQSNFESVMRKCMDNILKKAHEWVHVKKIAMPLFGVKTGSLSEESWAKLFLDRFVAFCCEFKNPDLEEIHIVTHVLSSSAYDKVKKIFHDYYEETSKDQNKKNVPPPRPPLPCGYGTDNIGIQESSPEKKHGSASVEVYAADDCVICMCPMTNPKTLPCGHSFCAGCVDELFKHKPVCPACGRIVGILTGDQPDSGTMDVKKSAWQLAGHEGHGSILITYSFLSGRQGPSHPTPGAFYGSMARTAYLPDTHEGRTVCRMLQLAFERRLVFTISQSRTTGKEGLTWNDIHHKTNRNPGTEFGYPDPDYLSRVKEELAAKGITEADLPLDGTGSFKYSTKH